MSFTLVLFICCLISVNAEETGVQENEIAQTHEEKIITSCADEHNVNLTEIFLPGYDSTKDSSFPCFFKCIFLDLEYVDDKGTANLSKYKEHFIVTEAEEEKLRECTETYTANEECLNVMIVQSCFLQDLQFADAPGEGGYGIGDIQETVKAKASIIE